MIDDGAGKNLKILDYGCGVGDTLIYAAKRGWSVSGVEVEGLIANFCTWRLSKRGIIAEQFYRVDEVSEYPILPSEYFDLVVCNATIEHLKDPATALQLIRNAKKKDGKEYIFIDRGKEIDHIANLEGVA
jgi:SAM-dependent methyltransferase